MTRQDRLLKLTKLWDLKKGKRFLTKQEICTLLGCSIYTLKADVALMRKKGINLRDRRRSVINWEAINNG